MTKYITHREFSAEAICGNITIPANTELTEFGEILFLGKDAICCIRSENAHQYFAKNSDGQGLLRGELTQHIQSKLAENKELWDRIWEDEFCRKYKRPEYDDYWLWSHEFFEAPIEDLKYISNLL